MRVMVVHNYYQQAGGEDYVVRDEVALLRSHGDEVHTFFRHNDAIKGMTQLTVARATIWNGSIAAELHEEVRRFKPAVVHFHNTFPLISPAAYRAARKSGAAVVQTLHNFRLTCNNGVLLRDGKVCEKCVGRTFAWPGVLHRCYRDSFGASAGVAAMTATHRLLGTWKRAVDAYITLSAFQRERLAKAGVPEARMHIKPNFAYDPGVPRFDSRDGYAMYLGRLSSEKGLHVLIDAWRRLGDRIPLWIVGNGPMQGLVEEAQRTIPNVHWLGGRSDEQVRDLLRNAQCLVVPSVNYEGFPRVLVEACSHGTPVIASGFGSLAEWVVNGETGLHFEPGHGGDLAAKVEALFADEARQAAMRRAARAKFECELSDEMNYRRLMHVYALAMLRRAGRDEPVGRETTPRADAATPSAAIGAR
jgi:glycosyltransferase involved in cell wall biosynthesis